MFLGDTMKLLTTTLFAFGLAGGAVLAESADEATSDPATSTPEPDTVMDWSGAYVGGAISTITSGEGTYVYSGEDGDAYDLEGEGFGLFGGYNWQRGRLVYGAELGFTKTEGTMPDSATGTFLESTLDLKARLGGAFGDALVYGFAGYSTADWTNEPANALTNPAMQGYNVGVGVDYSLSNDWAVGAEFIHRQLETDFNENDNGVRAEFGSLQLRVSRSF